MREDNSLVLIIKLIHREINNPAEPVAVLLNPVKVPAKLKPQITGNPVGLFCHLPYKEDDVTIFGPAHFRECRQIVRRKKLGQRPFHSPSLENKVSKPL